MVNDAKKHESEDKDKRELVDIHNQAEQLIYQTEKNMGEYGDKLSEDDKKKLSDFAEKLKSANSGNNVDDIKSSMDLLNTEWNKLASKMYETSKDTDQPNTEAPPTEEGNAKKERR